MKWRTIISFILCISLIYLCFGFANIAPGSPENSEENVITAADSGGGNLTYKEILLYGVIIGLSVFLFCIVFSI